MLRRTTADLKGGELKSVVQKVHRTYKGGRGYAKIRSRSFVETENKGLGSGFTGVIPKQRLFKMSDTGIAAHEFADTAKPLGRPAKTLSPQWRPFALADGGVLFVHPSQKQVLAWSQQVMKREADTNGLGSVQQHTNTKIEQLLADNTIEHVPLSQWRRQHMWALVEKQAGVRRKAPVFEEPERKDTRAKHLW